MWLGAPWNGSPGEVAWRMRPSRASSKVSVAGAREGEGDIIRARGLRDLAVRPAALCAVCGVRAEVGLGQVEDQPAVGSRALPCDRLRAERVRCPEPELAGGVVTPAVQAPRPHAAGKD
jgi:hypothetical protein